MSTVPPGHKIITRTSAITANYRKTDPQQAIGDPEGIFIKKDTGRTIFGVGTKTPYSRISMGEIGSSLADQTPALAFTEDASGNYASGISFFRTGTSKMNLRFIINELQGGGTDLEKTQLEFIPTSVTDAPILSLTKTIETVQSETLENGQEANTGNKVFINCIEPIRGGLSQRSGLEVNGMISLTDRLNFFRTSVVEEVPIGGSNTESFALFHEQADGSKKQLLTRTGQNRVIDASHTLISVLPDAFTNGAPGQTTPGTDPSGIFLFKNCDFVIGNGEMAASSQLGADDYTTNTYWERFKNISTSFLNLRGNTFFGSVFDISSAEIVPIVSKACENIDYSRNGVLYLQNNLGIGSYQPRAIIDCSKVDLPFLMMGKDINGISNNTVAFGDDLNVPLANYSFIFGKGHDLSGSPREYNSNYNFLFGKNIDTRIPNRLNYNFIYGKNHIIQGDYNFLFGENHDLAVDVSYCTLLGYNGKIDASGIDSAVMKYTLGENNDIFVLTRQGDINILKDICCNDICSNEIIVKYIAKPSQYAENAYIKDISAENISLEKDLICDDIVCGTMTAQIEGTTPLFKVTTKLEAKDTYTDDNYFLKGKKILHTSGNILNIDSSSNIIFNTNQTDQIYINDSGNFSIGQDNLTTTGTLYAKAKNVTLTNGENLLEGLQFGKDGDNDYYLRLASDANKKTNIEFGIFGAATNNKIVYDNNENSLNTYYDGSYNIYNGATKKIAITPTGVEINAPLTLTQSELTTKNFTISDGGRIHFKNPNHKIQYDNTKLNINTTDILNITGQDIILKSNTNFKNIYIGDYSIFNDTVEQFKLTSSELNINTSTKINNSVEITGNLIVAGQNVGDSIIQSAGGSAWSANSIGLYIDKGVAINVEKGNLIDDENPFNQFFPKFDFDISGNLRTNNMILGRPILNMIPFDMKTNYDAILNNTYSKGNYILTSTNPSEVAIWKLFDNDNATFWESENNFNNKNTTANTLTVEKSVSNYSDISNNYEIVKSNIDLLGERLEITLPQLWTLKYYGFRAPPGDLSNNMPSKWYLIGNKGAGWKIIDEKDISDDENNYFQENKYYYFNLDPSNNFSRDNYTQFGLIFNQIFNDGEDPNNLESYLNIPCKIGDIKLFGTLNDIPDLSSNIIQTELQNNGVEYNDISNVNQKRTKHLSLQPFGGRVGIYNTQPKVILDISSDDAIRLPIGDNNFKNSGVNSDFQGCIRFNTQDNQFEGCDGINWGGLGGVVSLDQQTKIVATDASGLKFINDGSENVIIDESGNVGIGTMIPRVILDISSNQAIRLPAGTTSERPFVNIEGPHSNPHMNHNFPEPLKEKYKGSIRFNTDTALFEGYYGPGEVWKGFNEVITKTIDICCNDISFNGALIGDKAIIHDISLINVFAKTDKIKIHSDICGNDASFNNISINDISCNGTFFISTAADISNIYVNGGIVDLSYASMVIVPQLSQDNSSNKVATTGYVRNAISHLIDGADPALDTLKEIADFLKDDQVTDGLLQQLNDKQATLDASNRLDSAFIGNGNITDTVFGHLADVTSAIQTQLDGKQATITGAATTIATKDLSASMVLISNASGEVAASTVTDISLNFLNGVTSAIQTQLDGKQDTITGAAKTIDTEDLPVSKALISDTNGKVAVHSTVTDTELGYLYGVTSGIQTQIDGKQATLTAGTGITIDGSTISATGGGGSSSPPGESPSGSGSGIFTVSGNNAYYNTGNIGIGTSTPTHTLDVVGEIHATSNIVSFTTSDRKLKNNLAPIEDPLEKLKKINGYTFEWVKDEDAHSFEGKDIGVIAQEVEEVLPEVTITREDGYKAVRYEKMVPFLISCIKEQQKQIDELRELLKK